MTISRRQLAASLHAATHIAERGTIAAFVAAEATAFAPNPFARTSAGAVLHVWRQRAMEFRCFDVEVIGLTDLLTVVSGLRADEPLVQEILRAGPHTANLFHRGDGCRIVGAVLYAKAGAGLPATPTSISTHPASGSRLRARSAVGQLDLFG